MWEYNYHNDVLQPDELMHYGVLGMKWGRRMARGHAGPGRYLTRKRQLAGDKRDLEALNKGQHLSVGLTKKRQAAYDAKDRARLEKRIAKNEERIKQKAQKNALSDDAREAAAIKKKKVSQMSNAELQKLNNRQQLERTHSQLNKSTMAKGLAVAGTVLTVMNTVVNITNKGGKVYEIGKNAADKVVSTIGKKAL